jgi:pyridoxine 4-dehydrogenase
MIGTAWSYAGGESEATIADALSPPPPGLLIASKAGLRSGRPDVVRSQIEDSFERLRAKVIGLYYLHRVDLDTPLEESLAVIKDYVDEGRILHVGVSEANIEQVERARKVVDIAAVQNHYNLSERRHEAVVDYCDSEGIPFVPFFPLRGGADVNKLDTIALRHRRTREQIALAWLLRRSPVMLPIPGTLSLDHVKQNLAALEIDLSNEEFEALR